MGKSDTLRDANAHQAIHSATYQELQDVTALMRASLKGDVSTSPVEAAAALIEVWEERVLAHAIVEETDLYPIFRVHGIDTKPWQRDHNWLRRWVEEARERLEQQGQVDGALMARLEAALLLMAQHSADEEDTLRTMSWPQD